MPTVTLRAHKSEQMDAPRKMHPRIVATAPHVSIQEEGELGRAAWGRPNLVCILARCILIWHALYSSSSREDMVSIKNLARTDLKDYKRRRVERLHHLYP